MEKFRKASTEMFDGNLTSDPRPNLCEPNLWEDIIEWEEHQATIKHKKIKPKKGRVFSQRTKKGKKRSFGTTYL
jgi:hypothetical protein